MYGPWEVAPGRVLTTWEGAMGKLIVCDSVKDSEAAYLAALAPEVVLALLDELADLRGTGQGTSGDGPGPSSSTAAKPQPQLTMCTCYVAVGSGPAQRVTKHCPVHGEGSGTTGAGYPRLPDSSPAGDPVPVGHADTGLYDAAAGAAGDGVARKATTPSPAAPSTAAADTSDTTLIREALEAKLTAGTDEPRGLRRKALAAVARLETRLAQRPARVDAALGHDGMECEPDCAACHFARKWQVAEAALASTREALTDADDLLRRLSGWDVLNLAPGSGDDGPYWQAEIARALAVLPVHPGEHEREGPEQDGDGASAVVVEDAEGLEPAE